MNTLYKAVFVEFLYSTGYYETVVDDLTLSLASHGVHIDSLGGILEYILSEDFPENIFDYIDPINGASDYVKPLSEQWKDLLKEGEMK